MSHRIKAFVALAIFTLFYHLAALDSVSGLLDTKLELKSANPTTKFSLSDEPGFRRQLQMNLAAPYPVEDIDA
jgi:hypothetical protein